MKYEPLVGDRHFHIYNRGNNREDIFLEERNYSYFLLLVQKHILPVAQVLAYCLLKNHYHLLIKTRDLKDENLNSKTFSNLFKAYSKAINKAYGRRGSLFQDRFKRIVVNDEEYLKILILYIHLNPMNHNFTDDFASYKYSSFRPLLLNNCELVDVEGVIDLFGDTKNFKNAHILRQDEILERDEELFLE